MDMVSNVEVTIKGDLRRIGAKPGETLLLGFRERLPITAMADVKRKLEHDLPGVRVEIVAGLEFAAIVPAGSDVIKRISGTAA